jgi:hypothetical protein
MALGCKVCILKTPSSQSYVHLIYVHSNLSKLYNMPLISFSFATKSQSTVFHLISLYQNSSYLVQGLDKTERLELFSHFSDFHIHKLIDIFYIVYKIYYYPVGNKYYY